MEFPTESIAGYDLLQVILGAFFVLIGAITVLMFVPRLERKEIVSFGLLSIATGIFTLSHTRVAQLVFQDTETLLLITFISVNFIPITLCYFYEQVFGPGFKRLVRRFWQIHLASLTLALVLSTPHIISLTSAFPPFFTLFFIVMLFLIVMAIREGMKGNREAKIFTAGILFLGFFCTHDIVTALAGMSHRRLYHHWGMFLFILSLGMILKQRFAESQARLKAYAENLEVLSYNLKSSNKKLEEYSKTLEQKVAERTRDLNQKNKKLLQTLQQLREMQNQLLLKEKMISLGHLVAGIAHELNNPVGALNSATSVLNRGIGKIFSLLENTGNLEGVENNGQIQKVLNLLIENNRVITQAGNRITAIVKSLKSFANLDEAEYKKVNVHDCIDSVLTLLEHDFKDRIEIVKEYSEIPKIFCYCNQLNQLFMNLLKNAVQAIQDTGTIRIRTFIEDRYVHILISDTGVGIPADRLEKIFEFGFSSDNSRVKMGSGLMTAYYIVQKHNGEIKAKSETGKGSTFEVLLPAE